jgi:hypothetical protein
MKRGRRKHRTPNAEAEGSRGKVESRRAEDGGKSVNESPIRVNLSCMSARWFVAALVFLGLARFAGAYSWNDDSQYVRLGPRTGYYIVRPDSSLSRQLGIQGAPTIDTADPFRHGYGADALAFRFNNAGVLAASPAYVVQATPNEFYTRRLGSFIRGRSTLADVKAFFGRPASTERQPDGFIAYYAIQVYNPFEDRFGRGGH